MMVPLSTFAVPRILKAVLAVGHRELLRIRSEVVGVSAGPLRLGSFFVPGNVAWRMFFTNPAPTNEFIFFRRCGP